MTVTLYDSGAENLVRRRVKRVQMVTDVAQQGMVFAWQNPEDKPILVTRVVADVVTGSTGAPTANVGVTTSATGTASGIFAALAIGTTGVYDHMLVAGTGAGGVHKMDAKGGTNDWLTGKEANVAAVADMVAYVYIEYLLVE